MEKTKETNKEEFDQLREEVRELLKELKSVKCIEKIIDKYPWDIYDFLTQIMQHNPQVLLYKVPASAIEDF